MWITLAVYPVVAYKHENQSVSLAQQAYDVEMTSTDVDATSSRRINVNTTSLPHCVPVERGLKPS